MDELSYINAVCMRDPGCPQDKPTLRFKTTSLYPRWTRGDPDRIVPRDVGYVDVPTKLMFAGITPTNVVVRVLDRTDTRAFVGYLGSEGYRFFAVPIEELIDL